jgi:tetratricopeptide (TPR) repeat protein
LDDLEQYLKPHGLDTALLRRIEAMDTPVVRVLATIRATEHERFYEPTSESEAGREASRVLERARQLPNVEIRLAEENDADEQARAARSYPGLNLERGLARELAATDELVRRYENGRGKAGGLLVRAAADWRRAGLTRAISTTDLRALVSLYSPSFILSDDEFAEAVAWGGERVSSSAQLLALASGEGESRFVAIDFIVSYLDGEHSGLATQSESVPQAVWGELHRRVDPLEQVEVGHSAFRHGDANTAKALLRETASRAHREATPRAEVELGRIFESEQDFAEAKAAYRRATESGERKMAEIAGLLLGMVLFDESRHQEAEEAFHVVARSPEPDPERVARAESMIGVVRYMAGDFNSARAALERAIAVDHAIASGDAELVLATMWEGQGKFEEAQQILQRIIDAGHPQFAPKAMLELATAFEKERDSAAARATLERALATGHPKVAPDAQIRLAELLARQGETDTARSYLEHVLHNPDAELANRARLALGKLLHAHGDVEGAREVWDELSHSEGPKGDLKVGRVLAELGDPQAAAAVFRTAMERGDATLAAEAALELGRIEMAAGRVSEAEAALRQAIAEGDRNTVALAHFELGRVFMGRGDQEATNHEFQAVLDSRQAEAASLLGELLVWNKQTEEAEPILRSLAAMGLNIMGLDTVSGRANLNLGIVLEERGEREAARECYARAARVLDREIAPRAALRLGSLSLEEDFEAARRALSQAAAESEVPALKAKAHLQLGIALQDRGDLLGAVAESRAAIAVGDAAASPVGRRLLALVLKGLGDHDELQDVLTAMRGDASEDASWANLELARLRLQRSEGAEAVPLLAESLASDPPNAEAGLILGELMSDTGRLDEAEDALRRAASGAPPVWAARASYRLGALLVHREDLEGAEMALRTASESPEPETAAEADLLLGVVLVARGQAAQGRAAWNRALASPVPAQSQEAALRLGNLLHKQGELDEAERVLRGAVAPEGRVPPGLDLQLGVVLWEKQDLEGARDALTRAVSGVDPQVQPTALFWLADVLIALGASEEARGRLADAAASGDERVAAEARARLEGLAADTKRDHLPGGQRSP